MAFFAVGIRVRLFVFALLALVSGYQRYLLFSFILGDSNFFFFEVDYPEANPIILVFRNKVYEIALSDVLATQIGVTAAQHQSQLV